MKQHTVHLYLSNALHVSGGISTHHQELITLYLQYLALMSPLLLPVMDVTCTTGSSNGLINARYCRYSGGRGSTVVKVLCYKSGGR